MFPSINWNMCDGCGKCVENCPKNVLELKELLYTDYKKLRWDGKLKVKLKGAIKANVINASGCIGCGKCVDNCHEKAIKLSENK